MVSDTTIDFSIYKPRMTPNNPDRLHAGRTILISLSFFTVLMAWSYFNFKVPLIIDGFLVEMDNLNAKETVKGVILAIDNLIAVIVQPFFGNLSDRTRSKYGRRMPYIIAGTALGAIFFVSIPMIQLFGGLILIIFFFDLSMAIYRSVSIAILPDYTSDKFRSKASAIQQFIANMGGVLAFLLPTIVKIFGVDEFLDENNTINNPTFNKIGFIIIAVLMLLVLIVQIFVIKETPTGDKTIEIHKNPIYIDPITFEVSESNESGISEKKVPVLKLIKDVFTAKDKSFRNMLFVVFFAYTGFAAVEAFFSSFVQNYMGKTESVSSFLFLAYSGPMIITAFFWGLLGQKIGRKKAAKFGLIGIIIATLVMIFITVPNVAKQPGSSLSDTRTINEYLVMLNLAFISMPWMCFIVNSFPIIWSLAPEGKIGTYTGVYYTFNQFAYSWAPILLGLNLDFFQGLGDNKYLVMFPLVGICMMISLIFMVKVKSGEVDLSKEQIKEYQEKYAHDD